MTTTATTSTSIKISSSDEQEFTVDRKVAEQSLTIKNMLEGKYFT